MFVLASKLKDHYYAKFPEKLKNPGGGDFFYFPTRKRPRMLCISSFVRQAVPDSWSGLAERTPRNFSSHWWFDQE